MATPIANVAEEAEGEELLPYKELFTTDAPEQRLIAAATSCFHVLLQLPILLWTAKAINEFNSQRDEFNGQSNESTAKVINSISKACNEKLY